MGKTRYFILYIFIALICNTFVSLSAETSLASLYTLGNICTIELFAFLYCCYQINESRVNYSCVFMLVLFVFHFGQLILYTFFQNVYPHIRFLLLQSEQESLSGFMYMNYAYVAMCIGILWKELRYKGVQSTSTLHYNITLDWIGVAKTIIYATFFVKFALDLTALVITITAGGVAARAWVNIFPNILLYYGKISLVGFALLIMALKNNPKRQLKVFTFIELYILVMMMSGIRSENVGYLVVLLFVYIASRQNRIHAKDVVLYSILGFFALSFIVAVGEFRTASERNFASLLKIALGENNVLLSLLDTLGDTGYTCHAVIHNYLPKYGTFNGGSYVLGLSAIIPNLLPSVIDFGAITTKGCFPVILQDSGSLSLSYQNIGGSFLGELFFNFGIIGGIIAALFMGVFIGWVSKKSSRAFKDNDYYSQIILIPIMFATIYWVRDYFGGGVREAVWGALFAYYIVQRKISKANV